MNKQRKVLITITYNEMGIIIDTKAEEVAQPNLQPTCNQLATDTISRQAAIDALDEIEAEVADGYGFQYAKWREYFCDLPSAQPEPSIPISWIDEQIEWLNGLDNGFSTITAMQISTMVNKWNREGGQNE